LPGGAVLRHAEEVLDTRQILARADAAGRIPQLGGMARPNGIVIVSERFWAFAGVDGSLREGAMPRRPETLRKIPLVRGLARLAVSLSPMFRRTGVTRGRERALLVFALLAPFAFVLLPAPLRLPAGIVLTGALVLWLLRGRTLRLHGAEHRAIAAVEARQLTATWTGCARPSRFSPRCGTNFAALVLPVTVLAERMWPLAPALYTPLLVTVLSLALTMELWQAIQVSGRRLLRPLLLPGLGLQRLTTREPSLDDTQIALTAVASVLDRELD
jgi:uncharacterized protein YqhQ